MNDIEKVIEIVKGVNFCGGCTTSRSTKYESCENCPYYQAKQTTLEALKKQIPQKIKKADIDFVIYGCPFCDYSDSLWSCGKHDKHCPNCGQMLDWSEKE